MNDIFAKRRARLLAMKAMRDNYVPGDKLVTCPKCGRESEKKAVAEGLSVCPLCGYHFPIGAYYRLSTVLDSGTFRELNAKFPAAVKTVFEEHAYALAMSSTKSMTGHMLGAAGAVEAVFTALSLHDGFLPATINYRTPDPECDLDVVPNQGRTADVRYAMSNSLGFGGHNGSLLLKKWEA